MFVKKVRYLKREEAHYNGKLSIKKEVPEDIYPYEYDYLEDVPHMEREREDNAPKLSFRFLKQSVNADQRRIIVGYLIRLGVSIIWPNYGYKYPTFIQVIFYTVNNKT